MEKDNFEEKIELDSDEKVRRMMENWDSVRCNICKKKISMLNARLIDESYFICKEHIKDAR